MGGTGRSRRRDFAGPVGGVVVGPGRGRTYRWAPGAPPRPLPPLAAPRRGPRPPSPRAAGPPPRRAPTPARLCPLLPARPERENGARFASGSDECTHLHVGVVSQWDERVRGTPGPGLTDPLGTLPKAGQEALGWEWWCPAGAPTLTPLLPQCTGLLVPYQHLCKLSREFEWMMTSLKGVGQLCHQPHGQSRVLTISLTSFAWNGDGASSCSRNG